MFYLKIFNICIAKTKLKTLIHLYYFSGLRHVLISNFESGDMNKMNSDKFVKNRRIWMRF